MSHLAVILGLSGPRLTPEESDFFREIDPWAFILFARNVETPEQVKALTASLRESVGRNCLIFVDQEGGRVQRLRAPHWRAYPAGKIFGQLNSGNHNQGTQAAYLSHRLIADDLRKIGITADCAPVLDLPVKGADPIISDRAFDDNVAGIVRNAHAAMAGLMAGGVAPVIKHIPGHGRASVDSHKALPVIKTDLQTLENTDFKIFKALNDAPMAMTAHAVFEAANTKNPVTIDKGSLNALVRKRIGFDGLLMSDDLDMKALSGDLTSLTKKALSAGCDVALQCSGVMESMVKIAKGAKPLSGRALERARVAENCAGKITEFDRGADEAYFDELLGRVA